MYAMRKYQKQIDHLICAVARMMRTQGETCFQIGGDMPTISLSNDGTVYLDDVAIGRDEDHDTGNCAWLD